jgi:hypothetical protein
MANALYGPFKHVALGGTETGVVAADLNGDDIQAKLLDQADYTVNLQTHVDLDDVPAAAEMSAGGTADMGTPTLANGSGGTITFDAPDTTFTAVTGDPAEILLIFNNTGAADANRLLIVYFDTATGLPVTPNGGNIVSQWNASGIFTW